MTTDYTETVSVESVKSVVKKTFVFIAVLFAFSPSFAVIQPPD